MPTREWHLRAAARVEAHRSIFFHRGGRQPSSLGQSSSSAAGRLDFLSQSTALSPPASSFVRTRKRTAAAKLGNSIGSDAMPAERPKWPARTKKARNHGLLKWWRHADSNRRPSACHADALPTELCPRDDRREFRSRARNPCPRRFVLGANRRSSFPARLVWQRQILEKGPDGDVRPGLYIRWYWFGLTCRRRRRR